MSIDTSPPTTHAGPLPLPLADDASGTALGVCNLCEAICGLTFTVDDGRVTGVRGSAADPLSRGYVCPKGVSLVDVYDDPDRLRRPLRKVDGAWVEVGWDEALDLVAERLVAVATEHGRNAVATYLGNPSAHSLGGATHGAPFLRTLRTRNRFSASSVDQIPHQFVAWQLFGHQLLLPIPDLDRTQHLLVIGANPMASNGSLMTSPDFPARARALRERGGRLVVIDPRRTETAKIADEHHFVRPGTDAALLLAMVHTVLAEDLATPASFVDGVAELTDVVADFTPERAEAVCGIDAETIRRLARDVATADGAAVYGRIGVSTHSFGSVCQWAIACLNILTGNLDREGGVMFPEPAADVVGMRVIPPGHFDAWRSRVRAAPEFAGELPTSVLCEEIETPGEGQVRALLTIAGNPVLSTPDGAGLARALDTLDFMVAVDFYLNETTRHADVILPPTSALERDQYDLVFHTLAVRNTARFTPALHAIEDDQRHDWQIFAELAVRMAAHAGTELAPEVQAALRTEPRDLIAALLDAGGRVSMTDLLETPEGLDLGPLRPTLPDRLQTEDGRIHLVPDLLRADLERLRATLDDVPAEGELLLIGRRHKQDCNSWLHNTTRLTRGRPRHHLLMHPDDLAARGLTDGAPVRVRSRVGEVVVEVSAVDDVMPGVVSLPHGYGHQVDGVRLTVASRVPGVSINDLTDPERLDLSGNAALTGIPVTVTQP